MHPYQSFRWQTRQRADERPYAYHPYAYALSNPILLTDPTGYCSIEGDDYCFPDYGISISTRFISKEQTLIRETVTRYASLLGGEAVFRRNVLLHRIEKAWPCGDVLCSFRVIADNAAYDSEKASIELSPNLYTAVIDMDPDPNRPPHFVVMCPLDIFGPKLFPNVPKTTFPNQETVFQFVLAHEMTHALIQGNRAVFDSFIAEFWPPQTCFLVLTCYPGPESDPSIERNQDRIARPDWRAEVLADAIAGYLFAPGLLGSKYTDWIEKKLRLVLR